MHRSRTEGNAPAMPTTILIIEDSPEIRLSARFILEDHHFTVLEAENPFYAKERLADTHTIDLILLDMNFSLDTTSGEEGLEFLAFLNKHHDTIPVVAMTAWSSIDLAVTAMHNGACDFIEKPWKNQRLIQLIQQQLQLSALTKQNKKLNQQLQTEHPTFIYQSEVMANLFRALKSVASTDANILLTGENGTGKTDIAHWLHQQSTRHNAPFVAVNMGAIPDTLFESEMFGHKKGAFTDAKEQRIGRFELADTGTLFLDEVANIPLNQQAKLLRVLEKQEFEMVGSSHTQTVDVRMICASNGNFTTLIADDLFRQDLFYRINTLTFHVPALRERPADIIPLAEHFIAKHSKKYQRTVAQLTPSAQAALCQYPWPGNVRELSHVMERAVLLCQHSELHSHDLHLQATVPATQLPLMTLEAAEQQLVQQALQHSQGNVPKAATLLGLTKSSMYRRLEKYGLHDTKS